MKNNRSSEKAAENTNKLENIIESFGENIEGYKFVLDSYSYYMNIDDEKVIGIDENMLSEVKNLIKYDKKYLSAIKMTVYHEIGHSLFDRFSHEHAAKEAIAELYAINRGSIDDYIIEIAVISNLTKDKLNSGFNQTLKEPKDIVEYLLKHDNADKWENRRFAFYVYESTEKVIKDALDKIKLPYTEIFERVLMERENINSLKRKNNLFIDKDMISRK